MIFVSSFVASVGMCLTNNDDFSQLTVSAFRFSWVCSPSVNVPAWNWFSLDCVCLLVYVSSFVVCAYESLWHTVITFCSWLSLHFFSSKLASFQSMSRIRLILRSVSHPCDFWFQFRDVYSNHSDEQWLSFSWLWGNSVSIVFQVRDSLCLHQIDFFGSCLWWFLFPVLWCP